jgi:hypothetical protein
LLSDVDARERPCHKNNSSIEKSKNLTGNRTRCLRACNTAHQQTMLPCLPIRRRSGIIWVSFNVTVYSCKKSQLCRHCYDVYACKRRRMYKKIGERGGGNLWDFYYSGLVPVFLLRLQELTSPTRLLLSCHDARAVNISLKSPLPLFRLLLPPSPP